jgi:putative drug exporter of the RND superfamily
MLLSPPPAISLSKAGDSAEPESSEPGSAARASGKHRPVTERIACWSARHAVLALIAWLLMTAGAVAAGHLYGTASQPQYDPGRSGVAERMLDELHVVTPPNESILIQPKAAGATYATDPSMRLATRAVVAALRAMPGPN